MEVRLEQVRFSRGRRVVLAVDDLLIRGGATTALVGPNGSGKSTLLRLIAGLERPAQGHVAIDGAQVRPGRFVREHVAFAFQSAAFIAGSVRANLELGLRLRGVREPERSRRVRDVAHALGVGNLLERDARRLSGGEAQRVNVARALCLRAPVTLLDEPLAGLDAPSRRQLLHDLPRTLRAFASTAIVVTHDRDEALRLAPDIVVLIDGQVRAAGPRETVFARPPDAATASFLGYTLLEESGDLMAIAPRGLRPGPGDYTFAMTVSDVLDFGLRREAWGTIAGTPVSLMLGEARAEAGETIVVSAAASMVRVYAGNEGGATTVSGPD